jgi:DNA-binding MarR family transcriptional regulator
LIQLARGITAARGQAVCDKSVMSIVKYVAISGIPRTRWQLIRVLWRTSDPKSSAELGQHIRLGAGTLRRTLEDLWVFGLVERTSERSSGYRWRLSDSARDSLAKAGLLAKPMPRGPLVSRPRRLAHSRAARGARDGRV